MDPELLRLNILINCSQPVGSWSSNESVDDRSAPANDTMVAFLWGRASQVFEELQPEGLHSFGYWQAAGDTPDCRTVSFVVRLVYGIRKIFPQMPGIRDIETLPFLEF